MTYLHRPQLGTPSVAVDVARDDARRGFCGMRWEAEGTGVGETLLLARKSRHAASLEEVHPRRTCQWVGVVSCMESSWHSVRHRVSEQDVGLGFGSIHVVSTMLLPRFVMDSKISGGGVGGQD